MERKAEPVLDIRIFRAEVAGYPVELSLGDVQYPRGMMPLEVVEWAASGPKAAEGGRLFELLLTDPTLREAAPSKSVKVAHTFGEGEVPRAVRQ